MNKTNPQIGKRINSDLLELFLSLTLKEKPFKYKTYWEYFKSLKANQNQPNKVIISHLFSHLVKTLRNSLGVEFDLNWFNINPDLMLSFSRLNNDVKERDLKMFRGYRLERMLWFIVGFLLGEKKLELNILEHFNLVVNNDSE